MKFRDIADYIFLAVTWGFSFLVLLKAVAAFGWIGVVAFRCLIAAATLWLAAKLLRRKLDFGMGWKPLAIVGATTVAGQLITLSYATPRIGTAMAAIFVAAIPLFSIVISQLWGIERISPTRLFGLALGGVGLVLLVGFPEVPITEEFLLGCTASVVSSFCAAFGSNYAARSLKTAGAWEITIGAFLSGGIMSLPLILAVPVPTTPQPLDYLYLVTLGAVMSALTYVRYFRLVAAIGPTKTISVEFVVTTIAVLVGTLLLQEPLAPVQLMGAGVIIFGCALVLGLVSQRHERTSE
jgi:drug/metabolite transporter (DMT)-like permease